MKNLLLCLCLVGTYFTSLQAADTTRREVSQLKDLFEYLYKNQMFNGSVGVKVKDEVIFKHGYGWGNADLKTPMLASSQTEIASVSKHFTATAILLLRDEGELALQDDINRFFSPKLPYEGVTIAHLLTHTSGMPDYEKYFTEHWKTDALVRNQDIVDYLLKEKPPLQFEPGSAYQYSNLGYILLAEIVKAVSGENLDTFLHTRIFRPHGLHATGFIDRNQIFSDPNYAFGRVWHKGSYVRPESLPAYRYVGYLSGRLGSGRLTSSVEDLLTWDSLLYTDVILPKSSLEEMYFPRVETSASSDRYYGYGWFVVPPGKLGRELEHSGSWPGNRTFFKRYIDDHSAIVLLSNSGSPYLREIVHTIDAILKGVEYTLPKRYLHEYLSKEMYNADFDPVEWLKVHVDLSDFIINRKALEKMAKEADTEQNKSDQAFFGALLERL